MGHHLRAPPHKLGLELVVTHDVDADRTPAPAISRASLRTSPQEVPKERKSRRPTWLSPDVAAWLISALDFTLISAAAAAAFGAYSEAMDQTVAGIARYLLTALLAATLFVGAFDRLGGYRLTQLPRLQWQLTRTLIAWGITVSVLLLFAFLSKTSDTYSRVWTTTWFIVAPLALLACRCVIQATLTTRPAGNSLARSVVIVGAGNEGQRLIAKLRANRDKSIVLRGVFDDRKSRLPAAADGFSVLGTTDDLLDFARRVSVDEVVIALPLDAERRLKALCDKFKVLAIDLRLSIEPLAEKFPFLGMGYLGNVPVLEIANRPLKNWCAILKWIEDKALAALLLMFLGPLMAIIAAFIKLDNPGPVFFVQKRFGFHNEVIGVIKFRTMYVDRGDPSGAERTVQNDPRMTPVGRYLRLLSLDELPQLINVLRGDMSLVGPRPHAIAMKAAGRFYWEAVEDYFHRHRVRPGITGWAQVNGLRGEVDTLEKARARVSHDLYYIDHWSLWLDLKILLMTVGILTSHQNAY